MEEKEKKADEGQCRILWMVNVQSLNTSLIQTNQTNITVLGGKNGSILLTFSSPSTPATYNP